jgi:glyoxylase-like metal-dependent hydrolase (beta-lactamase superfamily II)
VILIPAGNASSWTGPTGNNTWLLTGSEPALIDAGVGARDHMQALERALDGRLLARILITHSHPDHIGGVPALLARWPDARVTVYRRKGEREKLFCSPLLPSAVKVKSMHDGELIAAGDVTLRAVHTPGHAPDHYCFFDQSSGDVFCGDLARAGGTIVIPASRGGSLSQYLDSLRRIRALAPRRLLPGHGPIVLDPVALLDEYIRHRMERESQIVDALRAGCSTPEEIVPRVYGSLDQALRAAAADSVLAHLIKLEEEGRATRAASPAGDREPGQRVWRLSASRPG